MSFVGTELAAAWSTPWSTVAIVSALRRSMYAQSRETDPSLAEGMHAVQKDMSRAVTGRERQALAAAWARPNPALFFSHPP